MCGIGDSFSFDVEASTICLAVTKRKHTCYTEYILFASLPMMLLRTSVSLFLLAMGATCNAQTDSCPVERAAFTDNAPVSAGNYLIAQLDSRLLTGTNVLDSPSQDSLGLEIMSTSAIQKLLVAVSRSDDPDAAIGSGTPSVPCSALTSGIEFEPNDPQESITAFISIDDDTRWMVLDVTVVLDDGTFLFDVFRIEFVDTSFVPPPSPVQVPMPVTVVRGDQYYEIEEQYNPGVASRRKGKKSKKVKSSKSSKSSKSDKSSKSNKRNRGRQ